MQKRANVENIVKTKKNYGMDGKPTCLIWSKQISADKNVPWHKKKTLKFKKIIVKKISCSINYTLTQWVLKNHKWAWADVYARSRATTWKWEITLVCFVPSSRNILRMSKKIKKKKHAIRISNFLAFCFFFIFNIKTYATAST